MLLITHKSRENVYDFIHFKTTLFAAIISDRSIIAFLKLIFTRHTVILLKIWLIQSFILLSNGINPVFLYTKQVHSHDAVVNIHPSECQANEMFKNENFS